VQARRDRVSFADDRFRRRRHQSPGMSVVRRVLSLIEVTKTNFGCVEPAAIEAHTARQRSSGCGYKLLLEDTSECAWFLRSNGNGLRGEYHPQRTRSIEGELPVPNSWAAWLSLAWNSGRQIDEAPGAVRIRPLSGCIPPDTCTHRSLLLWHLERESLYSRSEQLGMKSAPAPLSRQIVRLASSLPAQVKVTTWGVPKDEARCTLFYFGGMPCSRFVRRPWLVSRPNETPGKRC